MVYPQVGQGVIAREEDEQPGTVAIRGEIRKEVKGVCVQVGKGTCDMN